MGFANAMLPTPCKVKQVIQETHDTFTLCVENTNVGATTGFGPGQFNMLYAFGVGEVPVSISSDSARPEMLYHTIRRVGAVTGALTRLQAGDTVGVRGPFGSSWPLSQAQGKDVVIIAGGIGLAPLRPAIIALLQERDRYGEIVLLVGARSQKDLLFSKDLERWRGQDGVQVKVTIDSAGREWKGNVGVVTTLISRVRFDPANTTALLCGPEVMMRFSIRELANCGVLENNIYLTMERNMKCAIGFCGHCQFGPAFICKDGPVFSFDKIKQSFNVREI